MRFREWDTGGDMQEQATALEQMQTPQADSAAPAPAAPKASDAPVAKSAGDWKKDVTALGVDPGWVVAVRQKLVESGKVGMDDIQADALADPEHRKWLNRQMRKANEEAAAASAPQAASVAPASTAAAANAVSANNAATASSGQQAAAKAVPSVLKPGHLPTGPLWQTTATPSGSGWIPARDGLWWPPWPVTGGPIEKPAVKDATAQANALDTTTGQARNEETGG